MATNKQISARIPKELYERFSEKVASEGKQSGKVIEQLIKWYCEGDIPIGGNEVATDGATVGSGSNKVEDDIIELRERIKRLEYLVATGSNKVESNGNGKVEDDSNEVAIGSKEVATDNNAVVAIGSKEVATDNSAVVEDGSSKVESNGNGKVEGGSNEVAIDNSAMVATGSDEVATGSNTMVATGSDEVATDNNAVVATGSNEVATDSNGKEMRRFLFEVQGLNEQEIIAKDIARELGVSKKRVMNRIEGVEKKRLDKTDKLILEEIENFRKEGYDI